MIRIRNVLLIAVILSMAVGTVALGPRSAFATGKISGPIAPEPVRPATGTDSGEPDAGNTKTQKSAMKASILDEGGMLARGFVYVRWIGQIWFVRYTGAGH